MRFLRGKDSGVKKGSGIPLPQTVDKTVRDVMSANRFFSHFQIASFFRFMHPNKRFSSILILARPLY